MTIHTTIYVTAQTRMIVENACEVTGLRKARLVILLLRRIMKNHAAMVRCHQPVEYQERQPKGSCRRWHLGICSREYEQSLDMRKFYKRSVSLIVANAVELYLAELVDDILNGENVDNYPYENYGMVYKIMETAVCWKMYWGLPPDLTEVIN